MCQMKLCEMRMMVDWRQTPEKHTNSADRNKQHQADRQKRERESEGEMEKKPKDDEKQQQKVQETIQETFSYKVFKDDIQQYTNVWVRIGLIVCD